MGDDTAVRYTNTVLYDDNFNKIIGNVLLHKDGSWSASNGDEDVVEEIDGSNRVITRSLQNWHTHLAMQLNARDFSDGYPLHRWLNEAIFPTEARITPDYVRVGTSAAAAEMIRTGSTFAADMYFFPAVTGDVLTNAGLRGLIGGPVSDAALPSHDDAESALAELDQLLSQNNKEDLVQYAIATHSVYLCSQETLQRASELAERRNGRLHIHVSETRKEVADCKEKNGMYPVEYLNSIDFIQPGTISDQMIMNVDFAPTLIDFAGLDVPGEMQGTSFKGVFTEDEVPKREAVYYHYYEWPIWHQVQPHYGIRTDKYKLMHFYYSMDEWELYDLENDPQEMNNIYNEAPKELISDLKQKLDDIRKDYKDDYSIEEMKVMTDTVITRIYNEPNKVNK